MSPEVSIPILTPNRRKWLVTQLGLLKGHPDAIRLANALIRGESFKGRPVDGDTIQRFWELNDLGGAR
jgi:hypothetical protein